MLERREAIVDRYRSRLSSLTSQVVPKDCVASPWLATFCARDLYHRDAIVGALEEAGIETRPVFIPLTLLPPYRTAHSSGPLIVSREIARTGFCLPTYVGLTDGQIDEICDIIMSVSTP